ncbi:unnamed protein product [Sphagnum jensenii]|uniref:BRISC and BRCA1-A complex member 1 n=1 Tax=Sphagnum jensenii TaxID=128206 RepID=A0ABP1B5U8_9BRYO
MMMMMMQGGMEHVELQPLQEPVLRYEMGGVKGLSRLDAVKQALVLFVHSKLLMHPQHRFSVATLSNNAVWHQQEFTNDMEVIGQAVRSLASGGAFTCCDLSELFQIAAAEAHSSHSLDRTLRVVLIYCSSSGSARVLFRHMCVLLLHPQQRCPQDEFDAPKDLAKMVASVPRTSSSGGLPQLRKEGNDDGSGPRTF